MRKEAIQSAAMAMKLAAWCAHKIRESKNPKIKELLNKHGVSPGDAGGGYPK